MFLQLHHCCKNRLDSFPFWHFLSVLAGHYTSNSLTVKTVRTMCNWRQFHCFCSLYVILKPILQSEILKPLKSRVCSAEKKNPPMNQWTTTCKILVSNVTEIDHWVPFNSTDPKIYQFCSVIAVLKVNMENSRVVSHKYFPQTVHFRKEQSMK